MREFRARGLTQARIVGRRRETSLPRLAFAWSNYRDRGWRGESLLLQFIRTHIWSQLPKGAPFRTRLIAAVLWCAALPLAYWVIKLRHAEDSGAALLRLLSYGGLAGVVLLLPFIGEQAYLTVLRVFSIVGFAVSNVALMIVFYAIVTPMAFFFRVTGKNFLDLKFKAGAPPEWRRHEAAADPRRYYRLF